MPNLLRFLWSAFKAGWKTLGYVGLAIGTTYIPADIRDLPKAYGFKEWSMPNWIDQTFALYALLMLAGIYILWIDVRPFVRKWREKKKPITSFSVSDDIVCESHIICSDKQDINYDIYSNIFYLQVSNHLDSGETFKTVQSRMSLLGPQVICRIANTESDHIDIRHGEHALFEIGRIVSNNAIGLIKGKIIEDQHTIENMQIDIDQGVLSFIIYCARSKEKKVLNQKQDIDSAWIVWLTVSADDRKSVRQPIKIEMKNKSVPVAYAKEFILRE